MNRRLFIVAVFLVAGAVVNVAVALGIIGVQRQAGIEENGELPSQTAERLWCLCMPTQCGDRRIRSSYISTLFDTIIVIGLPSANDTPKGDIPPMLPPRPTCIIYQVGWPSRSMMSGFRRMSSLKNGEFWAVRPDALPRRFFPYPLRPIWPGFAINTLVHATFLWLLIPGPFVLRRFIRVRRGLCPACAYPMGESHVCSECGNAVPSRKVTVT